MLLSTALDLLHEKVQELGKQKFWFLFLGLLFIAVTLINGVGIVPEEAYRKLSENPFTTRTDIHFNNYFQETLLLPVIAHYLKLTSRLSFNALCFAIIVGAYILFVILTSRRHGSIQALIFSALLVTSPLTTVLLTWLGMPDGLTVVLTVPFLFTPSVALIFVLTLLGTVNHYILFIAALGILVLRWIARDKVGIQHLIAALAGGTAGYLLVKYFLFINQIEVVSRFDFVLLKSVADWAKLNAANLPMSLFSLFNIQWLAILVCFVMFFKWDKRFYLSVAILLIIIYGITFFSLDTTRVFSLLSWGIFFTCIFHSYELAGSVHGHDTVQQKQFLQALILMGIVSIITPRYFSWMGEIHAAPFYQFMRTLLR